VGQGDWGVPADLGRYARTPGRPLPLVLAPIAREPLRLFAPRPDVNVSRSDVDDIDEIAESGEVVGIAGVERKPVGVRDRSDEQVGDASPM
jgi:hypothetical protein